MVTEERPEEVPEWVVDWERSQARLRAQKLREQSRLTPADLSKTFENFDPTDNSEAYQIAKLYAEKAEAKMGVGLMFMGPAGVGKTHLAMAMANALLARGFKVKRYSLAELMVLARSLFSDHDDREMQEFWDELAAADFLVLDDLSLLTLATAYEQARACEFLYRVVDAALCHRTALIITTNHTVAELKAKLAELDGNSDRIFSRLQEAVWVVEMKGRNRRPAARLQRTPDWLRAHVAASKKEGTHGTASSK